MSEIMLTPISPRDIGGRPLFNTGLSAVGRGGEDYVCGHCGHVMMQDFGLSRLETDIVFVCGSCGGHNVSEELKGRVPPPPAGEGTPPSV